MLFPVLESDVDCLGLRGGGLSAGCPGPCRTLPSPAAAPRECAAHPLRPSFLPLRHRVPWSYCPQATREGMGRRGTMAAPRPRHGPTPTTTPGSGVPPPGGGTRWRRCRPPARVQDQGETGVAGDAFARVGVRLGTGVEVDTQRGGGQFGQWGPDVGSAETGLEVGDRPVFAGHDLVEVLPRPASRGPPTQALMPRPDAGRMTTLHRLEGAPSGWSDRSFARPIFPGAPSSPRHQPRLPHP